MAVAHHTAISLNTPLYRVSISPRRFTLEQILEAKAFGVKFMPLRYTELIAAMGDSKGSDVDKFEKLAIEKYESVKTSASIPKKKAHAAHKCKLYNHVALRDHEWYMGTIVAV